jgi:hypothetical protein
MNKLLIALIGVALTAGAAQAAHKPKHKPPHKGTIAWHRAHVLPIPADPYAAFYRPGPRPPWAAPWQCFTDEGYGRYRPCDAGPSSPF